MLQDLIKQLQDTEARVRHDAACVLGLVEETEALGALGAQFKVETNAEVKGALQWAGKRIQAARQRGHVTLEALIAYFHIDREIISVKEEATENEKMLLNKMQNSLDMEMMARKISDHQNTALGTALGGALLGLPGMLIAAQAAGPSSTDVLSSNLGERPRPRQERTPATRPSTTDIRLQIRKLLEERDPEKRCRAAVDLGSVSNNPEALPYLAQAFIRDPVIKVRETAERAGKQLYWNTLYWQMEQDGSMAAEIQRRREALIGKQAEKPAQTAAPSPAPQPPPEPSANISDILRKAEQARQKRKR
jgi:hypothetical protein